MGSQKLGGRHGLLIVTREAIAETLSLSHNSDVLIKIRPRHILLKHGGSHACEPKIRTMVDIQDSGLKRDRGGDIPLYVCGLLICRWGKEGFAALSSTRWGHTTSKWARRGEVGKLSKLKPR